MTRPPAPFAVNGIAHQPAPGPDRSLLIELRDGLGLLGAKPGCGEGVCGACTVLLDGAPARACQVHLSDVGGRSVRTVEGLASDGRLHPVQQAFLELGAFQCGYCTPGMILGTVALLERDPDPDAGATRSALHDNVCRCGSYPRIARAGRGAPHHRGGGSPAATAARAPAAAGAAAPAHRRPRRPWDLSRAVDRDWFDVLPPGLIVVHEPGPSAAGDWTTSAGAWLHVGADGAVTAFTGKVDVGQDNRTALSMLVADELGVALDAVSMVMGDTDLCPHDQGTFGSRSMVDAGSHLRAVATGARWCLIDLAAHRLAAAAVALVAEDGVVRPSSGGSGIGFGQLVAGQRRVELVTDVGPAGREASRAGPAAKARAAGRVDGPAIVTGVKRFPSDLSLPGMLHGRVLRPPAAGATVRSIDTARVEAMAGVTVVRDGDLVGIVAPNPFAAGRALAELVVEWDQASGPSEAELDTWLRDHPAPAEEAEGWAGAFHHETGDVDAALAVAPTRLAATYTAAYIAHVPLETHVALAAWDGAERLTVWTGTQVPFGVRSQLAQRLGIAEEDVRVIVPDTGGGFGGKHAGDVAAEAARLARATGRPVKVRWSRSEEFTAGYLRPAAVIDIRSGTDGATLTAWEMRNVNGGTFGLTGPYEVLNQRLDYQPAASPLAQGSYRALAATANHFARESHMDEVARTLGQDPLGFRLAHVRDERLATVLQAAATRIGWDQPRPAATAVGIAGGIEKGARVATAVEARVGDDRRLEILRAVTAFECGRIIYADGLANQVEGAFVQGLGGALFEAIRFDDGVVHNASMTAYRVPRIEDVPPIEVILLDRPDLAPAGGGETPIIAVAPAVANAIHAATGIRLRAMPLVPDGLVPDAG
jgi:nicotinate dehydrogenase subunit B